MLICSLKRTGFVNNLNKVIMSRLNKKFHQLTIEDRKAFIPFIMAGFPNIIYSNKLLNKLPTLGADIIEIGMPFTDPMADGKIIQDAGHASLEAGFKFESLYQMIEDFRKHDQDTPIILMGYYNPIHKFGSENFVKKIKNLGVDGLIVVDLPPEEDSDLCVYCLNNDVHFIRLLTPTSDNERLPALLKNSSGFLYYVSVAGVTGTKVPVKQIVSSEIERIKGYTDLPVCVGFGIKSPEDAKAISLAADGVVVGSAIIEKIQKGGTERDVSEFISSLSKSVHLN